MSKNKFPILNIPLITYADEKGLICLVNKLEIIENEPTVSIIKKDGSIVVYSLPEWYRDWVVDSNDESAKIFPCEVEFGQSSINHNYYAEFVLDDPFFQEKSQELQKKVRNMKEAGASKEEIISFMKDYTKDYEEEHHRYHKFRQMMLKMMEEGLVEAIIGKKK